MSLIVTVIVAVIGSSGVASVVVAILQHHWTMQEVKDTRIDALVSAQQVMMVDRVRHLGQDYIKAGCISLPDKENIHAMYDAYKALGGNGHLNMVMEEVDRLEVR